MDFLRSMNRDILPRRGFRFSLCTLFVVVTVLCLWLGYCLNWRSQRQAFWKNPLVHGALNQGPRWVDPPWMLRIFPEEGVSHIYIENANDQQLARAQGLFPEAIVEQWMSESQQHTNRQRPSLNSRAKRKNSIFKRYHYPPSGFCRSLMGQISGTLINTSPH